MNYNILQQRCICCNLWIFLQRRLLVIVVHCWCSKHFGVPVPDIAHPCLSPSVPWPILAHLGQAPSSSASVFCNHMVSLSAPELLVSCAFQRWPRGWSVLQYVWKVWVWNTYFTKLLYFEWSPPWRLWNLHSILCLKYANTHRSKAPPTFCLLCGVFGETATSMVHLISPWHSIWHIFWHSSLKSTRHFIWPPF